MPKPEMLPADIQELAFRHALPLDSGMDFHSHADRLITGIGKAVAVAPRSGRRQQVAEPTASTGSPRPLRKILIWTAAILLAGGLLALAMGYVATHKPQPAKQVATAKSNRGSVEPATTPSLFAKPPAEQSPPPQLAVEQPKPVVEQRSQPQITRPALDFASITKEHPYENSLGMKFVPVPITGGPTSGQPVLFSIWDTRVKDFAAFVEQGGYDMSKGEAAYTIESDGKGGWTWKQAGGNWKDPHFPPEASQTQEHPVVCVSWNDAVAFCQWLTDKEHRSGQLPQDWSYRLPSDHEWSCAVGIGKEEDASQMPEAKDAKIKGVYPWGKQWPPPRGARNYAGEESRIGMARKGSSIIAGYDDGAPRTSAVGQYTANEYGLYDMGG